MFQRLANPFHLSNSPVDFAGILNAHLALRRGSSYARFRHFSPSACAPANATPSLVIDQDTGAVISAQDATEPWYPASLTKLMTAYVVLDEIRAGRLSLRFAHRGERERGEPGALEDGLSSRARC